MRKWIPLLILLLALTAHLLPGPRTIDDSFITFRYARNLLSGEGFVYNPGEQVMGTTTPLYTLLMAGLGALSGGVNAPFPTLALLVNALAAAGTCWLLIQLGRTAGVEAVGMVAATVWAVAPYSVTFAVGGLETSVYVFLLTLTLYGYAKKRRVVTAAAAILAVLTRPDAVLLVGPLVLDRLYRAWKHGESLSAAELLTFLLPGLAWAAFATLYFGSPIPHSVQAKLLTYRLDDNAALIRLIQHYATPFLEQNIVGSAAAVGIGLVVYPFLYLVGASRLYRAAPRLLAGLIYPFLYFLAFALPNPLIFRWYLTPPLPVYFLVVLTGGYTFLSGLLRWAEKRQARIRARRGLPAPAPRLNWPHALALAVILLLPLTSTLSEWRLHPDHGPDRPAPEMAWFKLELLYRQAAGVLEGRITPGDRLAAGDVGVLGFTTGARILDTVGLNSPESLRYYPLDPAAYVINYAIPTALILDERPDYIVVLEVYGRRTFLQDARFQQEYRLLQTLPTDIYGSRGMLIFERR